jgi:tetratricopeptide (TPR) repeat protein
LRNQLVLTFLLLTFVGNAPCLAGVDPSQARQATLDRIAAEVETEHVSSASTQELEKILEGDPNNARAHLLMGESLELLGLRDQAAEQFKIAVSTGPNYPPAYVGLVKEYLRQGNIRQGKALIQEAKTRFPKDHEIEFWLGNFYQQREELKEAMEQYQAASKSEKPIFGLGSAIAKIELKQRRYYDAIVLAGQDLRLKPNYPLANEIKGMALHHVGRYKDAIAALSIAFAANPYNLEVTYAYAQCLYWLGDYKTAMAPALVNVAFKSRLNGNDPNSKRLLSQIIDRIGSENAVSQGIVNAGLKYPINKMPAYHFALGDVLDRSGFNRLAMKEYETGLDLEPKFGRAWYRLGLDYESLDGNYKEALNCYEKARKYYPGDKQIVWQQARLEDRLANRKDDLAWQLKDRMRVLTNKK